jgi:methylated-DNA-[protein]-cysteine S-methyltransferase
MYVSVLASPLGTLRISADEGHVVSILFGDEDTAENPNSLTLQAKEELKEYFAGKRIQFTFPFHQEGSVFSQSVWAELTTIRAGNPISYRALAKRMNNPPAIRAIASANGRNNIAIVVPCHRVIGSNGDLVGYAGGLWRKKWLLEHEAGITNTGQSALPF